MIFINTSYGQTVDSIRTGLDQAKGSERIDILHQTILSIWLTDPEQAMSYGVESLELSVISQDSFNISKSLRLIGAVHYHLGNYDTSLVYYQDALEIALKLGDLNLVNKVYNNIGLLYYTLGTYETSLEYLLRSLEIKESIGETYGAAATVNNIGLVFNKVGNFKKARDYFFKASQLATESENVDQQIYSKNNIGTTYLEEGELLKARGYFKDAWNIANRIGNTNWGSVSLRSLGSVFQSEGQYDSAEYYYQKSLFASKSIDDKNGISEVYYLLAKLSLETGNLSIAVDYLNQGHKMATLLKSSQQILQNLKLYGDIYEMKNQNDKLVYYQNEYINFQDSLFNEAVELNLSLLPIKLKEEKDRIVLSDQHAELQKKNLRNQQYIVTLFIAFPLFLILLVLFRKNRRAYKALRFNHEELKSAQEHLVYSEKMASLGMLASGIAHEINNPLNYIKNGALTMFKIIEKENKGSVEDLEPYFDIISEGVNRASGIVKSLNHFTQVKEGNDENCDIHEILEHCLVILSFEMQPKSDFVKQYSIQPVVVKGNEGKLHQAFLSILSNAEHAIKEKGTITISTKLEGNQARISIKDTGVGISQTNLQKINEPFYTTKGQEGTGLGLFVTYSIIEEHNGRIKVSSIIGEGSEFVINLPLHNTREMMT